MSRKDDLIVECGFQGECKVAVIGAGYMAKEHIPAFQDILGVEVVGIHSRTRSRAEALASEFCIPHVCGSIQELYEKTKAKLVVIAVPELYVNEVSCACFLYPWTALIEKPAGYDVADAEAIERAACEKGRSVFVALNRRHYGSTRSVLADLATRTERRVIQIQDQEDALAALKGGNPRLVVENWMYANSIHIIDYFTILARGAVLSVDPIVRWDPDRPGFVAAKITYDSGDIGLYSCIWNGPGPWAVSVNLPDIRWEMRPLEKAAFQTYGKRVLEPVKACEWDAKFKPGIRLQAELGAMAAIGQATTLPSLQESLISMRLTQAIYS